MKKQKKQVLSVRMGQEEVQAILEQVKNSGVSLSEYLSRIIRYGMTFEQCEFTRSLYEKYKGRAANFTDKTGSPYSVELKTYGDMHKVYTSSYKTCGLYAEKYGYNYVPEKKDKPNNGEPSSPPFSGSPNGAQQDSVRDMPNASNPGGSEPNATKPTDGNSDSDDGKMDERGNENLPQV